MTAVTKLTIAVFATAGLATGQDKNPFHGTKDGIESGRGMFRIYCAPCHGIGAKGGRAPDLTGGEYSTGNSDDALFRIIANGAEGTEMPGFSDRFENDGIWRLVAYIRSVAGNPAPPLAGDRAAGEKVFWGKGGCGACHRIETRGGRMGPDLTLVGRQRSATYVRESIVDPNALLTPGYPTVTVVTREGRKITGTQRGYDAFSAQLMDAQENFHSYFRSEVASITREFKSLMPSYEKTLAAAELNDLLVYLSSLRGKRGKS